MVRCGSVSENRRCAVCSVFVLLLKKKKAVSPTRLHCVVRFKFGIKTGFHSKPFFWLRSQNHSKAQCGIPEEDRGLIESSQAAGIVQI